MLCIGRLLKLLVDWLAILMATQAIFTLYLYGYDQPHVDQRGMQ